MRRASGDDDFDAQPPKPNGGSDQAAALLAFLGPPEALYPRWSGKNARGQPASFRLPDGMDRVVDLAVQLGRERGLPWQNRADFFRDGVGWFAAAIMAKFEWNDPFLVSLESRRKLEDRLEYLTNLRAHAERSIRQLTTLLLQLITSGESAEARRELQNYQAQVSHMPERFIRTQYEAAMLGNERFQQTVRALEAAKADSENA